MTDFNSEIRAGTAVITGAGSGLGRALAVELSSQGIHVVGFGRRGDKLDETRAMIKPEMFLPHIVDVSDFQAVNAAFDQLEASGLDVTILINNAAIYDRFDFLEGSPETYMNAVNINLGGVLACSHAALRRMSATGVGRIVNVATFADLAPLPGSSAYSVSKGAARVFTRALIADMKDRFPNIVINDWAPGALNTQMGIADGLDVAVAARWGAKLALWHDPAITGVTFSQDCEVLSGRSMKRRIKDLLLLKKRPVPRRL